MNILLLPSWYTTPENPISGIFFKEQALALQSYFDRFYSGSKIYVLVVEQFSVLSMRMYLKRKSFSVCDEDGITTIRDKFLCFPKLYRVNLHRSGRKIARIIKRCKLKLNLSFDLVHIHSALNAGIWYLLSGLKIPYVITEHSCSYSRNLVTEVQKAYLQDVFDNASHIIAVGNGLVHEIGKYTKKRVEVIFNIVAPSFDRHEYADIKNNTFTFFSLGVNARKKGFDILLTAFQNCIFDGMKSKLVIAGLLPEEKKWLLSIGIADETLSHVELLEKLDRDEVYSYMETSDCFVLVSRHETFGVVFAEAMYCGKPVIASITGGPDSFVTTETGLLVPTEDIEKTSEAMKYMYENYSAYDSAVIKNYAEEHFSADVICSKLTDVYRKITHIEKYGGGVLEHSKLKKQIGTCTVSLEYRRNVCAA